MSDKPHDDKDDETMRHQIDATRTETVRFVDRLESKWRDIVAAQKRGDYNEAEQCRAEFRSMLHGGWTEIKDALLASSARSSVATNEGETPRTDALMNMQMSDNPECGGHRIGDATEGIVIDFCRQLERELAVANSAYAAVEQVNLQMQEASRSATAGWKLMPGASNRAGSDMGHARTKWRAPGPIDKELGILSPSGDSR